MEKEPTGQTTQTSGEKKKGYNWKLGIKIGCGVVLLLIVIVVSIGYVLIKDALVAFDEIKESERQLIEKYGTTEAFCPEADGSIMAGRMEVFLKVRGSLVPLQKELEASLTRLLAEVSQAENEGNTMGGVSRLIRDGSKVLPEAARYFSARNRKLLELGMGLGEYYYIYVMAYYAGLGIPPADGPDFSFLGAGNKNSSLYYAMQEMLKSREEKKRDAEEGIYWEIDEGGSEPRWRGTILAIMQGQLQRAAAAGPRAEESPGSWLRLLAAEIEKMKKDRQRIPWQDGLPKALEQSIRPFLERLKAGYIRLMNPLEFGLKK
jgi:hypothetical protein